MKLVYKFKTKMSPQLENLMKASNNLYNQALYIFRQRLEKENVWTWYSDMDKIMKVQENLQGEINYRLLKAQCSQQVLKVLDKSIKSYCVSIKDWRKNPSKYKGMPHLPNYRKRGGLFNLYYTNQCCFIKDGKI